ncbi:phage tail tape measure protein, partial [Patescibacteria group bacterium]|nr:phage tail tape measure protein [Patescibacteria group bacterium]
EAAESLAKLAAAFDLPIENIRYLASAINELSNTTASTSRDIVSAMERIGASGKLIGITAEQASAMAATLVDMGMGADRAGCVDDKTVIMTKDGWKGIDDISENDFIATRTPDGYLEYRQPKLIYRRNWNGDMIHFKKRTSDILVTPDHRMIAKRQSKTDYETIEAKDLMKSSNFRIPATIKWNGIPMNYFKVDNTYQDYNGTTKLIYENREIDINLWVQFMGYFLSEGCVVKSQNGDSGRVILTQNEGIIKNKMISLISKLGYVPRIKSDTIHIDISNKQLFFALKEFVGVKAHDKYVPNYIKDLPIEQLEIFLKAYCEGDGSIEQKGGFKLFSSSRCMTNDLEEISLKCGYRISEFLSSKAGENFYINNKCYTRRYPCYGIQVSKNKYRDQFFANCGKLKNQVIEENYKGRIWCPILPPFETVFIKRNGKTAWIFQTRIRRMLTELARKSKKISKSMEGYFANWGDVLREDPMEALLIYMKYLRQIEDPIEATIEAYETLGKVGGFAFISLTENLPDLITNLKTVENEMIFGTSLAEEYAIAIDKTSSALQLASNRAEMARRAFGRELTPTLIWSKDAWADLLFTIAGTTAGLEAARDGSAGLTSVVADTHGQFQIFEDDLNTINEGLNKYQEFMVKFKDVPPVSIIAFGPILAPITSTLGALSPMLREIEIDMNVLAESTTVLDAANLALASSNERIFSSSGAVVNIMEREGLITDEIVDAKAKYVSNTKAATDASKLLNKVKADEASTIDDIAAAEKNREYWVGQRTLSRDILTKAVYDGTKAELADTNLMEKDRAILTRHATDWETIAEARADA